MSDTRLPEQGVFSRVLSRAMPREGVEQRMVDGALVRMQRQRRRRRRTVQVAAVAAAAACVLCVVWITHRPNGNDTRVTAPVPAAAPVARVWTTTQEPETRAIGAHRVGLAAQTVVRIERATPAAPRLAVTRGKAEFKVRPLAPGGSFVVRTRHVRLEVVGTRFSVASSARCSQVRVAEGVVRATALDTGETERLAAGQARSYCAVPALADGLGRGGRMVRRALSLLTAGDQDLEQADRLLTRYLERYPDGPFAQEALFHLVFARQRRGREREARKLARLFLERFPATPRAERLRGWLEKNQGPVDQN